MIAPSASGPVFIERLEIAFRSDATKESSPSSGQARAFGLNQGASGDFIAMVGESVAPQASPASPTIRHPPAVTPVRVEDTTMVTFGSHGTAPSFPPSALQRISAVASSPMVLFSARRALEEAGTFLSSREADILARKEAVSRRERTAQQLATRASEELAKAKAEHEWLDAHRHELEEEATQKMAAGIKEGKDALAAIREKLISDTNHFAAERPKEEAALAQCSSQLDTREREARDRDISLDIHEANVIEKEGALEDRLSYVTSCEEHASAREAALDSRASKLDVDEGDLIRRRAELHTMINDQLE